MGAPSKPGFNLESTFFGFEPKHQVELHNQLFELIWAGDGRWSWDEIYHLPLHVRKLWIAKINKMRAEENERIETLKQKQQAKQRRSKTP